MTAGVLERPSVLPDRPALDGGGTLEELLTSALADVRANGSTECPVCHARMAVCHARATSTRAHAREAECSACGSGLS
jgi:nitrate/TMAO reductase-like tetraheme cytochrome c subunit